MRFRVALVVMAVIISLPLPASAQEVNLETAVAWPQFVIGPLGADQSPAGGSFDVELTISNGSPTESWGGEILMADQDFFPIDEEVGITIQDAATGQVLGKSNTPLFTQFPFTLGPLQTIKLSFFAASQVQEFIVGFMILNTLSGDPFNLTTTFAYNLRNSFGEIVDRIPVSPVQAGLLFHATMCKLLGFDTGFAIVALATTLVEMIIYSESFNQAGERVFQQEFSAQFEVFGQTARFPGELIENFPDEVPEGALVEIRSLGDPIFVMGLDVVSPPLTPPGVVQIAGKQVSRVIGTGMAQ